MTSASQCKEMQPYLIRTDYLKITCKSLVSTNKASNHYMCSTRVLTGSSALKWLDVKLKLVSSDSLLCCCRNTTSCYSSINV